MKKLFRFLFVRRRNFERESSKTLRSLYVMQKQLSAVNEAAQVANDKDATKIIKIEAQRDSRAELVAKNTSVLTKLENLLS